jgi:hypothetical protein
VRTVGPLALVLALLGVAGCRLASEDRTAGAGGPVGECQVAADCVAASTTCCGCPEFAIPDRGWEATCEDVACPDPQGDACAATGVACVDGQCAIACAQVACELTCPGGFERDASGCLTCGCVADDGPDAFACQDDDECVQVAADCCGCGRGGSDLAIGVDQADSYVAALDCGADHGDAGCPEVDVCDPTAGPRCVNGRCVLAAAQPDAADDRTRCGTPELPPCPDGSVCVLNADDDASMDGLGTCQPE